MGQTTAGHSGEQEGLAQGKGREFPCKNCGGALVFVPGTSALKCPYCGTLNTIDAPAEGRGAGEVEAENAIRELDFVAQLAELERRGVEDGIEQLSVRCTGCGGESAFGPNQVAGLCPFCGRGIVAENQSRKVIKPAGVLPFHISEKQAVELFRNWIGGLWLAPSDLKTFADRGGLKGLYTPAWTYDCRTETDYTGERGDDYWETEWYDAVEDGKTVRRSRQVRKTRWWPASGTVEDSFDDLLVMATRSLPEDQLEHLRPWDLPSVVPYRDEYLAGFVAESYTVSLKEGFDVARTMMENPIRQHICADIGGDHQRIHSSQTRCYDITYKHLLLPVWISSYRYRDRVYRFLVNARTGEIRGERPWSMWKIVFLVLVVLALVMVGLLVSQGR